ncbi:MAG: insulinase family protein [Holosporaceae bacterium]|nr:MAG: insulinase family protein [Holosporaceae bacterium]
MCGWMWVRAMKKKEKGGIAHFLEHMAFEGTKNTLSF